MAFRVDRDQLAAPVIIVNCELASKRHVSVHKDEGASHLAARVAGKLRKPVTAQVEQIRSLQSAALLAKRGLADPIQFADVELRFSDLLQGPLFGSAQLYVGRSFISLIYP